ncbi:MAG: hypothetical protein ACE5JB_09990 [bacterium]
MIEEKYIELINKEIDGKISHRESVKLKEYLAKNPEAQNLYNDFVNISDILNEVEKIEPSSILKKNILNSIQLNKYTKIEKKNLLQSLIKVKVNYKFAYSFAAGLIVGLIMFALLINNTSLDIANLTGTVILNDTSERYETAGKIEINLEGINGTVALKSTKNIILAEIKITTKQEIELAIEFDENDISFNGFRQLTPFVSNLKIRDNYLKLTNIGESNYNIIFKDETQTVSRMTFKIYSDTLLYEKTIYIETNSNF